MERKEKLLLTELIQDGAETVSDCLGVLSVAEYIDELDVEQSDIDGLRIKLTEFLADGGSETPGEPYLPKRSDHVYLASEKLVVYLANFAGETICWVVVIDDEDPELKMSDAYVVYLT